MIGVMVGDQHSSRAPPARRIWSAPAPACPAVPPQRTCAKWWRWLTARGGCQAWLNRRQIGWCRWLRLAVHCSPHDMLPTARPRLSPSQREQVRPFQLVLPQICRSRQRQRRKRRWVHAERTFVRLLVRAPRGSYCTDQCESRPSHLGATGQGRQWG